MKKNFLKELQRILKEMNYESEIVVQQKYGRPKEMLIINPGEDYRICPRVKIDEDMSIEEALERCKQAIESAKQYDIPEITKEFIEQNVELCLEEKDAKNDYLTFLTPFYDIQAYMRVRLDKEHSFRVTDKTLSLFDLDITRLYEKADFNTVQKAKLAPIEEMIGCSGNYTLDNCMFAVLTNIDMTFGGGAILNTDFVEHVKVMMNADNLVVLPSSVHELILVNKDKTNQCLDGFIAMVQEVNKTAVFQEDRLTDNAYTI